MDPIVRPSLAVIAIGDLELGRAVPLIASLVIDVCSSQEDASAQKPLRKTGSGAAPSQPF